jgi:hypothetical protein
VEAIARSPLYRQSIHHIQPLTAPSIGLARKPRYSRCEVIRLWQVNRHDPRTAFAAVRREDFMWIWATPLVQRR